MPPLGTPRPGWETTLEGLKPTALGGGTGTASEVHRDGVHGLREERS